MQVEAHKRRAAPSPLILMKAQKNDIEVSGMKEAHLRDAVALCQFMSLLEDKVGRNKHTHTYKKKEMKKERSLIFKNVIRGNIHSEVLNGEK